MRIGSFDTDARVLVIAEIGNNHEGSIRVARQLFEEAATAGADAVKLQTFRTEYFLGNTSERAPRYRSFELGPEEVIELAALARARELLFISTPLDLPSVELLAPLVDAFKIASGDNDFFPLLEAVSAIRKPLIVGGGLVTLDEIRRTVSFVRKEWGGGADSPDLAVLHGVTSYPVVPKEANIRAVSTLVSELGDCTIGYSDHVVGIEAAVLAVAAGARIIEKHFTLDHDFSDFRDHSLSADPSEFRELVTRIRAAEELLGSGEKRSQPCEQEMLISARRSIVAARDLPAGHRLVMSDLIWLRPGGGLRPGAEHLILDRTLTTALKAEQRISLDDVE